MSGEAPDIREQDDCAGGMHCDWSCDQHEGMTAPASWEDERAEVPDEVLDQLLVAQDELQESMGHDLDGTDFKDGEIARLLILAGVTGHLIRDLRSTRAERDTYRARLDKVREMVDAWMVLETCENFGVPYDCITTGKTLPCHNCRMRTEFRAALDDEAQA